MVGQLRQGRHGDGDRNGVTRRIYEALRDQIVSGVYGPADRLPSTRALAAELGVSRTTVTAAYDQLLSEGFLESRQGARARVALTPEEIRSAPKSEVVPAPPPRLSDYGQRLQEYGPPILPSSDRLVADFRYGDLSTADFPALTWKRAVTRAMQRRPERLAYGDPRGSGELRAALQGYLWRARSLRCEVDQIIIVNGSQQGLDLCARLLLDPGDQIVVEDPCYAMARRVFAAAGAVPVAIEADNEGLKTDQLVAHDEARLAYVTPSHQFPLGGVMSARRRQELLAWSQRANAYVIEDDYDSEYRYDIRPIPPLQAIGNSENVIYVGTVSKTLSPTIRLGYLVVPRSLQDAFAAARQMVDRHSPRLEQDALTELIASGAYERHVRKTRRGNGRRRNALLAALRAELGDRATIVGADAGLHVVVWFNGVSRAREVELISMARKAGVGLYPVSPLYAAADANYRPELAGIVMGYASIDEEGIERGVKALRIVLSQMSSPA